MKFSDFVVREAILTDLQATTKEGAIREIVRSLHHAGALAEADLESITRGLLGREELGSTGIGQGMAFLGQGVALPETRHPAVDREIGDRRGEGNALGNLGLAYHRLGQVERAIGSYEQRLAIAREIGDRRGEGRRPRQPGQRLLPPGSGRAGHRLLGAGGADRAGDQGPGDRSGLQLEPGAAARGRGRGTTWQRGVAAATGRNVSFAVQGTSHRVSGDALGIPGLIMELIVNTNGILLHP